MSPEDARPQAEYQGAEVAIVGAGIVGLTTAVRLHEAGLRPIVYTRDALEGTTSANAGAIWGPFLSSIDSRLQVWSYRTLEVLLKHASLPHSGVSVVDGLGAEREGELDSWWVSSFPGSALSPRGTLPTDYARGWSYTVPIIDMPVYLRFLGNQLARYGVPILCREVREISDLEQEQVVIAAGMGSSALVRDPQLVPCKGQLVVVDNPGIKRFFAERGDGPDLTYVLPQGPQVVLGGTAQWEFQHPDTEDSITAGIVERCAAIDSRLANAAILSARVGIRACRRTVRLEQTTTGAGQIIYFNYGHGGSGVSLSWGCAESVAELAAARD